MRWVFEFINEWEQLLEQYNWYEMTFIQLYFEKECLTYGYEFQFIILGLGIRVRYNTDKSLELFEEWDRASLEDLEKHL